MDEDFLRRTVEDMSHSQDIAISHTYMIKEKNLTFSYIFMPYLLCSGVLTLKSATSPLCRRETENDLIKVDWRQSYILKINSLK